MDFNQFSNYRKEILSNNPKIVDYSNTNLYSFFKDLKRNSGPGPDKYYRCHMVEDYLKMLKLPDEMKEFVGASSGVRKSLELLMKHLTDWIIPSDVYPFYPATLNSLDRKYKTYSTLGETDLFESVDDGTLLMCAPLKPQGRDYTQKEYDNLKHFLQRNPNNVVVVDLVYWCNFSIPKEFLELYKSNQVILLHSLSKMFISPNLFGIALLPQNDYGQTIRSLFQSLPKNEESLKVAYQLMHYNKQLPIEVKAWLNQKVVELGFVVDSNNPSYLFYTSKSPEDFMKEGVLVVPASVFGCKTKGSIISILL